MNWLFLLTYYRPHISGLTQSAANRAEVLAARGHSVTVLTSQHSTLLPMEEEVRGVRRGGRGIAQVLPGVRQALCNVMGDG